MKLNISYPANGTQKLYEFDDERKLRVFMEKRMGNEVPADSLGDEWKGYVRRPSQEKRISILILCDRLSALLAVMTSKAFL